MIKNFSWLLVLALVFQPALILAVDKDKAVPPAPSEAVDATDEAADDEELLDEEGTDEDLEDWDFESEEELEGDEDFDLLEEELPADEAVVPAAPAPAAEKKK